MFRGAQLRGAGVPIPLENQAELLVEPGSCDLRVDFRRYCCRHASGLEARGQDGVQLLVLPPVRHHLVGVRAVVVALQAVEVARALLICTCSGEPELDAGF